MPELTTTDPITATAAPPEVRAPATRGRPVSLSLPRVGVVLAGITLALLLPLASPPRYLVTVLTEVWIFAVFAMSLDLLMGYTGLASLGHAAYWGLGAYAAGIVAMRVSPSVFVAVPAGVLTAAVAALAIGALCIRTSGVYFLMLTLAFSQMVFAVAFKWTALTGGSNGLAGVPRFQVPGVDLSEGTTFYYVSLGVCVLALLLLWTVARSPLGHTFVGIRENEARMRAIGYDTQRYKLASFVIAGTLAGLGGTLYVSYATFASPADVAWTTSGQAMIMVIVGGTGTLVGPALGAALVLLLQNWVSSLPTIGDRWQLIMGLVFVGFVLFARGGIVGIFEDLVRASRGGRRRSDGRRAGPAAGRALAPATGERSK